MCFLMASAAFSRQSPGQVLYSPALQGSLRRLDALVDWERRARVRGAQRLMRVDVQPAAKLLEAVGSPQTAYRAVHVTGSKGKGSVSALVGAGLAASGAHVGIYGSPHVERVNERVRIAGRQIRDDALAAALDEVLDARERLGIDEATWFDVISCAGLLAFEAAKIDWSVVEVGLGGRLDSTNVLNAPVTVITNISLEHQDIIGPTLRDIAYEKAGIICQGSQPIVGMHQTDPLAQIFCEEARATGAREPLFVPPLVGASITSHNLALARSALRAAMPASVAEILLPENAAAAALAALPGRMECFKVNVRHVIGPEESGKPFERAPMSFPATVDVTLDGTHVAESVARLLCELRAKDGRQPVMLVALGKEKDASGICAAIAAQSPLCTVVTAVSRDDAYMPVVELSRYAVDSGLADVVQCEAPDAALECAIREAAFRNTSLIIIGSLHLAGKLRPTLVEASVGQQICENSSIL